MRIPCLAADLVLEMQELAARRDIGAVKMSAEPKALFEELRVRVRALAEDATQWKFFVHARYQGGVSLKRK